MADGTAIEWTDATWNPVRGCSRISSGCGGPNHEGGCYAERIAARFSDPGLPFHGFAERTPHGGRWTGKLALIEEQLELPLRWKKPRRIFVNSMSDLFHENLPFEEIDKVFAVMGLAAGHTFQILTKRAARMQEYTTEWLGKKSRVCAIARALTGKTMWAGTIATQLGDQGYLRNVWLGVSVEDQERADERILDLRGTPAAVRFLSCEPLLGPIDLSLPAIDWVIAGGESGPNARPMHPHWARALRDQCAAAGVPFFFKQWGEWFPGEVEDRQAFPDIDHDPSADRWEFGFAKYKCIDGAGMLRVGKKRAGRRLDGDEHNAFPERRP